ncbi:endonuclease V [Candidatus Woesearchaeota archaeon]|nr:endonuclease V [Candidatus Woesearchaeota archaeon]
MNIIELKKEQIKLAKKVVVKDDFDDIKYIGGCDQAFMNGKIISAIAVLDCETLEVVEKKYAIVDAPLPYMPGFLSYRESPAVVEAVIKLKQKPDIMMVPANGILHPRKMGMASHLGIILDMPTIGVAKKLVMGEEEKGKIVVEGEKRAAVLKIKEHSNPIYVSPGHRVSLRTATDLVKKASVKNHKLPEPIHEAHKYSNKIKKRLLERR